MKEFVFKLIRKIYSFLFYKYEYLYYQLFYKKPELEIDEKQKNKRCLIGDGEDLEQIAQDYKTLFPQRVQSKIKEADLICNHVFDLLGSGPKKISPNDKGYQPIDWHSDFKSDYRWEPNKFYRSIRYGHIKGVDIKVPWELSRFQHLNILGQAYILTEDKKYSDEFINQIRDWIKNNPVAFGVNWKCPMDIAIRAVNWLVAQEYFSKSKSITNDFWNEFYTSIYEHGKFIRGHLENKGKTRNNHYLSNLAGLFFISIYCPFFKESKEWQEFAEDELSKEIKAQVYPDGCCFEASTSYHRLALELFYYTELLAQKSDLNILSDLKNRIKKMFEFSLYCIKPNGRIPQIGDNDNGRFLIFSRRPILEHKYLLSLAAVHYKDSQFKHPNWDFDEEAFWVYGKKGKEQFDSVPFRIDTISSKAFQDAGWFIIRDKNDYCFISCGPNGQNGNGGHGHNDKLSFELMIDGRDIIVDPGTYAYTSFPEKRNEFRSTAYHNTVKFNGYEQNKITPKSLFYLGNNIQIKEARLKQTNEKVFFQGEIHYSNLIHKRNISKDKVSSTWEIKDKLITPSIMKKKAYFHLSPKLKLTKKEVIDKEIERKIISIQSNSSSLMKEKYDYSPSYGEKVLADYLKVKIPSNESQFTLEISS